MVARKCAQYLAELSRYNYVTPKSYLELLAIFSSLIGRKKQELHSARQRMKTGLDKVRGGTLNATILYLRGHLLFCVFCFKCILYALNVCLCSYGSAFNRVILLCACVCL